jgi:excinuclease ABC subunit A
VECGGSRLRAEARNVTFADKRIYEICALPIEETLEFFAKTEPDALARKIIEQIIPRLEFLCRLGLSYLALDRPADTLSGGELQRVRLATGLGGGLTGVCYVLDEPTIGLHPRDTRHLIESLKTLRQRGNTVLVVEHDDSVIREADYRIEIGPGSGRFGGELVEPLTEPQSSDCAKRIAHSNECGSVITLEHVAKHNLKNVTVSFPLQRLTCVTGVSGSGKSSLINETLVPFMRRYQRAGDCVAEFSAVCRLPSAVSNLIEVDQSPLGRSSRSNPATYSGLFDELRKLFASTKDAKRRGYKASRFSFNAAGGRCETCKGHGTIDYADNLLPSAVCRLPSAICPVCNGKRFNRQTLMVKYKDKSIADVLDMSIEEAATFLENIPQIDRILQAMLRIGLGYLALGQPSSKLSGGEAQRVKLATELAKPESGKTLYVLDEPTTGLHSNDVLRLLDVLTDLTKKGNTVIVIEHNLDVMSRSDWMIDLGPEGGERGGYILATGTPEQIAALEDNQTGTFLRQHMKLCE